jgi:hypothetical protein
MSTSRRTEEARAEDIRERIAEHRQTVVRAQALIHDASRLLEGLANDLDEENLVAEVMAEVSDELRVATDRLDGATMAGASASPPDLRLKVAMPADKLHIAREALALLSVAHTCFGQDAEPACFLSDVSQTIRIAIEKCSEALDGDEACGSRQRLGMFDIIGLLYFIEAGIRDCDDEDLPSGELVNSPTASAITVAADRLRYLLDEVTAETDEEVQS